MLFSIRVKARNVCFSALVLSDLKFAIVLSSGVSSFRSHMVSRFLVVSACRRLEDRILWRYPYR